MFSFKFCPLDFMKKTVYVLHKQPNSSYSLLTVLLKILFQQFLDKSLHLTNLIFFRFQFRSANMMGSTKMAYIDCSGAVDHVNISLVIPNK